MWSVELAERRTTWSVGKVPYKRGGQVVTSIFSIGSGTIILGCPHYSSPPLFHHLLLLETSLQSPSSSPPPPPPPTSVGCCLFFKQIIVVMVMVAAAEYPSRSRCLLASSAACSRQGLHPLSSLPGLVCPFLLLDNVVIQPLSLLAAIVHPLLLVAFIICPRPLLPLPVAVVAGSPLPPLPALQRGRCQVLPSVVHCRCAAIHRRRRRRANRCCHCHRCPDHRSPRPISRLIHHLPKMQNLSFWSM
jgi:hypothetical protein